MEDVAVIKVLVADDHRIVRAGIRDLLYWSTPPSRWLVDEAENTEVALEKTECVRFDVVLMDFWIPSVNGPRATEMILRKRRDTCVLGMSSHDEQVYAEKMVRAGAKGFLLKNVTPNILATAIRRVMNGKRYFSHEVYAQWLEEERAPRFGTPLNKLTAREKEILLHIVSGLRSWQIAQSLHISKRTVDTHREHLMGKLGVRTTAELVRVGIELGVLG